MIERDLILAVFFVAGISMLLAVVAIYFAWRNRERCDFIFDAAILEKPANRPLTRSDYEQGR